MVDVLGNLVDGRVEESQAAAPLLIRNRGDRCPLRRTATGATEEINTGRYAWDILVGSLTRDVKLEHCTGHRMIA